MIALNLHNCRLIKYKGHCYSHELYIQLELMHVMIINLMSTGSVAIAWEVALIHS